MEDQRFPFQDDFEKRLATLRLRADELVGQAVALRGFGQTWLGENVSGSYRKELEVGLLEDPGSHPEPARRIRGFSRVAGDLTRSLSELDGQADTLAGQERQLSSAHGALKELTEGDPCPDAGGRRYTPGKKSDSFPGHRVRPRK